MSTSIPGSEELEKMIVNAERYLHGLRQLLEELRAFRAKEAKS